MSKCNTLFAIEKLQVAIHNKVNFRSQGEITQICDLNRAENASTLTPTLIDIYLPYTAPSILVYRQSTISQFTSLLAISELFYLASHRIIDAVVILKIFVFEWFFTKSQFSVVLSIGQHNKFQCCCTILLAILSRSLPQLFLATVILSEQKARSWQQGEIVLTLFWHQGNLQ